MGITVCARTRSQDRERRCVANPRRFARLIAVHRAEPPAEPVRPIGEIEPFFRERQEIAKRWPLSVVCTARLGVQWSPLRSFDSTPADSREFSGSAAATAKFCVISRCSPRFARCWSSGNSCTQISDRLEHIANREQIVYTPFIANCHSPRGRPDLPCPPNPGHKEREK